MTSDTTLPGASALRGPAPALAEALEAEARTVVDLDLLERLHRDLALV